MFCRHTDHASLPASSFPLAFSLNLLNALTHATPQSLLTDTQPHAHTHAREYIQTHQTIAHTHTHTLIPYR